MASNADYMSASMASTIVGMSGIGQFNAIDLRKKLTGKVETLTRKVQTLQDKLAAFRDGATNQNPAQPTASTVTPATEEAPLIGLASLPHSDHG